MSNIADIIKAYVDGKGITYSFISEKTGIKVDALSKTFLGRRKLPADEMVRICLCVGLDINQLVHDYQTDLPQRAG